MSMSDQKVNSTSADSACRRQEAPIMSMSNQEVISTSAETDHNYSQICTKLPSTIVHTCIPSDNEDEYTEVFQKYFAVQVSLNRKLSQALKRVQGVKSLGVGFSTEREGYWPVIRVIADEETCEEIEQEKEKGIIHRKTTLIENVVVTLKGALIQLHPSTSWIEEELKNTIEIVIKYPLKAYELRSAGDIVKATYMTANNINPARVSNRGVIGFSVRHEFSVGEYVHSSDYEITAYHPVIPSLNTCFQQILYPLPLTETQLETTVRYKYVKESEEDSGDVVAIKRSNDPLLSSTLLRLTIFPDQGKKAFQAMKRNFSYGCNIYSSQQVVSTAACGSSLNAELVVGKSGLVKYLLTNDELEDASYEYNIVENRTQNHPCNIDIVVLKYVDNGTQAELKNHFPQLKEITLKGPPDPAQGFEGMKGKVVYLANGEVHLLSKKGLIKMNDPPIEDEYPGYAWNPLENVDVPHGHSGAPVFLVSRDDTTYHLLGSLITDRSASPLVFSLKMVKAEIAIHHIDQILAEQPEYMYETALTSDMIAQLKNYKQYLIWHNEHQSLSPFIQGKYIHCRMALCLFDSSTRDDHSALQID